MHNEETEPSLMLACEKCNECYPVHNLRNHVQQCRGIETEAESNIPLHTELSDLDAYLFF